MGPRRRLEIHNLNHAVKGLDADLICLQEVRQVHRREARHFAHWPDLGQADYLAPEGYNVVYRTNAVTRHGEHGNALLTRWPVLTHQHEDMSDHRFEQRGLLHAELLVRGHPVHVLVVHLGLLPASRRRQISQLAQFIRREVPSESRLVVAGDFNEGGDQAAGMFAPIGITALGGARLPTFPARLPLVQLDHIYVRGFSVRKTLVPRGSVWWRMSDHLPLIADLGFDGV